MPAVEQTFGWQEAIIAFAIILTASFLVSWVATDLLRLSRGVYVAILALTALALGSAYLAWSGTSLTELVEAGWAWGILAGLLAAAVSAPMIRRLPSRPHPRGAQLGGSLLWEGLVYGFAEAILLATLPVLAAWQVAAAAGWTDDGWPKVASGALAIGGALLVVLVHHLGYAEFRVRAARPKLLGALVVCGLQAVAFLLTGNVLAPVIAHIVLHGQIIVRGIELPPQAPRAGMVPVTANRGPTHVPAEAGHRVRG